MIPIRGALRDCLRCRTGNVFRRLVFPVVLGLAGPGSGLALDYERLQGFLNRTFGAGSTQAFDDWRHMIENGRRLGTPDKLKRVNEFFNRRIQFLDDQTVWGQSDYWATPMETLGKGKGDCEDFTIAKYFTLLGMGIADDQLRLIYAKAQIGGPGSTILQAHMVLAFYPEPDAEPLVLDNLITDIRPASRRSDLLPIFSFNRAGIWAGPAGNDAQGTGRLSRWQDLLKRARAEGFD